MKHSKVPPKVSYHDIQLPMTTLHFAKSGTGKPLIMVPATISLVEDWTALIQFMAQKFTVYFFELPGHARSKPFRKRYSSQKVAKTISDFIEALEYKKVNLMGFSFGGVLSMRTMLRIPTKIRNLILIAPFISKKALLHSRWKNAIMKLIAWLLKKDMVQNIIIKLMHGDKSCDAILWIIYNIGNVEEHKGLKQKLQNLKKSTLDVLAYQINEILSTDFSKVKRKFNNNLYLAMSYKDPLLNYTFTKQVLTRIFPNNEVVKLDLPYHQPPRPPTFEELNKEYGKFLDIIIE